MEASPRSQIQNGLLQYQCLFLTHDHIVGRTVGGQFLFRTTRSNGAMYTVCMALFQLKQRIFYLEKIAVTMWKSGKMVLGKTTEIRGISIIVSGNHM